MAGLVFTKITAFAAGDKKITYGTLAFDSSYPTNGEAYTYGLFGYQSRPDLIQVFSNSGYSFDVDTSNKKIKARVVVSVAGGSAAASTDAISIKSHLTAKESAGAESVPMAEAQNTADLSGLTAVPCMIIGSA